MGGPIGYSIGGGGSVCLSLKLERSCEDPLGGEVPPKVVGYCSTGQRAIEVQPDHLGAKPTLSPRVAFQ